MTIKQQVHSILRQHLEAIEAVCQKADGFVERLEEIPGPPSSVTIIHFSHGASVTVTTAMEKAADGYRFVTTTDGPEDF